jgi:hypothetical protein
MDMVAGKSRPVLLVGSVPLDSSASVFETVGTRLGELVKRIPDGETGVRKNWMEWQADVMKRAKGLQPGGTRPVPGGAPFQLYDVKPGETMDFGSLGYAAIWVWYIEPTVLVALFGASRQRSRQWPNSGWRLNVASVAARPKRYRH